MLLLITNGKEKYYGFDIDTDYKKLYTKYPGIKSKRKEKAHYISNLYN